MAAPGLGGSGAVPGAHTPSMRLHADDIGQAERRSGRSGTPCRCHSRRRPARRRAGCRRHGLPDLIERDLAAWSGTRSRQEPRPWPSLRDRSPSSRQIEPIGDRQARLIVGDRKRDRDLAIVLLAELPAILARNADRMLALLRKAGVVDDPGPDRPMPLDRSAAPARAPRQQRLVRPRRLGHEMMQRLMLRRLRPGAVTRAAIGSTLLRSPGSSSPMQ